MNEDYCQWCYADGQYAYPTLESLIDFLSQHMANAERTPDQIRAYLQETLPHLKHWKA